MSVFFETLLIEFQNKLFKLKKKVEINSKILFYRNDVINSFF